MSTAIAGKKLSTKPAEPDDRQRARQSKRHPDCRSTTINLTAHANIACIIVGPRQSSSRRDRRNGHPDCRCVPIQIVALQPPPDGGGEPPPPPELLLQTVAEGVMTLVTVPAPEYASDMEDCEPVHVLLVTSLVTS